MEGYEKMKIFPVKTEPSLIENLRLTMREYGFTKVSPFIRYILMNFVRDNKIETK